MQGPLTLFQYKGVTIETDFFLTIVHRSKRCQKVWVLAPHITHTNGAHMDYSFEYQNRVQYRQNKMVPKGFFLTTLGFEIRL